MLVRQDCIYFRGDIPCSPHKREGIHCETCTHYQPVKSRILLIKLGAIGDVIRTTPLLRKLRETHPSSEITWLTLTPEVVPSSVDRALRFTLPALVSLESDRFDLLINLDKDREAIALTERIRAAVKEGFGMDAVTGKCRPLNERARHKWMTGLFDDLNRQNTKSYPQEIFELCGFSFQGEKYILEVERRSWSIPGPRPLIGLNTGCGGRWTTRLWPIENWIRLIGLLKSSGKGVLLLGGDDEHAKNQHMASVTGAAYLGTHPLKKFMSLMAECDLVVTGVTMAMHIAIGLNKKLVLFNNIFNRNEFELYGLGEIVEPPNDCKGCFKGSCGEKCMERITPEEVFAAVERTL
jgi:ADP-heptose:LPS heptosyltransferase